MGSIEEYKSCWSNQLIYGNMLKTGTAIIIFTLIKMDRLNWVAMVKDTSENGNRFNLHRLADFINEAGMLRHTPRSGYAFLGSGSENVAEHSYRAAIIGHILAHMAHIDPGRVILQGLYHDLHEARTGDFNYVNHRYDACDAKRALVDSTAGTGLQEEILGLWEEFEHGESQAAQLARDADQLDLIANLAQELYKGNLQARDWLDSALARLRTEEGRMLAKAILDAPPDRWWREGIPSEWWINHGVINPGKETQENAD